MRRQQLQLLPHHLLVVARRFEYDWATDTARKRCERLDFPLLLPLPTALDGQRGAGVCRYGLYAVVVHTGSTANSGHYYAFARHRCARTRAQRARRLPRDNSPARPPPAMSQRRT